MWLRLCRAVVFCFNFSSMVEFEDEDQNMVSEKMSDMFILKRPRVKNSVN